MRRQRFSAFVSSRAFGENTTCQNAIATLAPSDCFKLAHKQGRNLALGEICGLYFLLECLRPKSRAKETRKNVGKGCDQEDNRKGGEFSLYSFASQECDIATLSLPHT